MKNFHYGKFPSMTSYPFCDVVVRSDDAFPPNGNSDDNTALTGLVLETPGFSNSC